MEDKKIKETPVGRFTEETDKKYIFDERQGQRKLQIGVACYAGGLAAICGNCVAMDLFGQWASYTGSVLMFALIAMSAAVVLEACTGCFADIHGKITYLGQIPLCIVLCLNLLRFSEYRFFENGAMTTGLCSLIGFGTYGAALLFSIIWTRISLRHQRREKQ